MNSNCGLMHKLGGGGKKRTGQLLLLNEMVELDILSRTVFHSCIASINPNFWKWEKNLLVTIFSLFATLPFLFLAYNNRWW